MDLTRMCPPRSISRGLRLWIFVGLLTLPFSAPDALEAQLPQPELSLRIGPTLSSMADLVEFSEVVRQGWPGTAAARRGFSAGGDVVVPFRGRLSVGAGVHFIQKGGAVDLRSSLDPVGERLGTFELRLSYLEIPLLLRADLRSTPGFFLYGGPVFSFEVACRTSLEYNALDRGLHVSGTTDCQGGRQPFERLSRDVGLHFGGGIALPLGPSRMTLGAGYALGLRDLASEDRDMELRQRSVSVSAGLSVPLELRQGSP
jgi:hypothetical protein